MTEHKPWKLPQTRMYLKTAEWGFGQIVTHKLSGAAFRFHLIGTLAALRAVQHALRAHDRKLSPQHSAVISEWWAAHRNFTKFPELRFIKESRDLILKAGAFKAYAIDTESGIGEGSNRTVTRTDYELVYYVGGKRRDLAERIRAALDWCDAELSKLEAKLPDIKPQRKSPAETRTRV
jgi:hypothetical protein